jgi:hypothetical protein
MQVSSSTIFGARAGAFSINNFLETKEKNKHALTLKNAKLPNTTQK